MALLDDILAWTKTLPEWQQDAARRLFQKPDGLSDQDLSELYLLLKAAHNLPIDGNLAPTPLSEDHLPSSSASCSEFVLKSLRDLKHVNCIAPDQSLYFEPAGMTVVYGGNGSGKSGYARVLKRACRARDRKEPVLPDATDRSEANSIPEAVLDIEVGRLAAEVHWTADGDAPDELAPIAVFDCHCARLYLTEEEGVMYLPYGLDIVEALANDVLPKLAERLGQELATLNTDASPFSHLRGETEAGRLIAALSHQSDREKLTELGTLTPAETKRTADLEQTLGDADPTAKARELRLSAQRLKQLAQRVDECPGPIDEETLNALKRAAQASRDARDAEQLAAQQLISGETLLPGTGESAWKTLFEAARKFSTEKAYPDRTFPNTEEGAVCVLCQQPLADEGERLKRFEQYIQDDVAKNAAEKREQLAATVQRLEAASLSVAVDGALATELDQLNPAVRPAIEAFERSLGERRQAALSAITSADWDSIPSLPESPRSTIRRLAANRYRRARDYERAADAGASQKLREELNELAARKKLSESLPQVLTLLDNLKRAHALNACKADLVTRPISMKSRQLASNAVTAALKTALDAEFAALGMGHIKTSLKDRNDRGRVLHQLVLDLPTSHPVDKILSEGEQRAISLGSFLAELSLADHSGPVILDDPVSSLDHKRRKLVAARLAEESANRQVIVFTHDVVFLHQLQQQCSKRGVDPGLRFLEKIGTRCGSVADGLPWDHKSYRERIDSLEKAQKRFEKLPWPPEPEEALAREMIQQYSFLRATIERVVQDFVLNSTVRRFEDYIRVENLDKVVGLTESEVGDICKLYNRCHGIVEAHDPASAKDDPPPTAQELGDDINAIKAAIGAIKRRRERTASGS